jgi:hypothetical protein
MSQSFIEGDVVRDADGEWYQFFGRYWYAFGNDVPHELSELAQPVWLQFRGGVYCGPTVATT